MSEFQALPPQKTNGMAIAGFVTALACCSPVGIILSAIGLSQIGKDPSQKGKGLATAGLIIGIISLIASIFYYIFIFSSGFLDSYDY
jgi:Domain of unknown function (DUF4190)